MRFPFPIRHALNRRHTRQHQAEACSFSRSAVHDDLAAQHPGDQKRMAADWGSWAARARVLPLSAWREAAK